MPGLGNGDPHLERSTSQISTASRRAGTARSSSRKQSLVTPNSAKSLVSFPSLSPGDLSPDNSPSTTTGHGKSNFLTALPSPMSRKSSTKKPSTVESLITATSSFRGRSALFDDSPKSSLNNVPGALHLTSDEHIQHLIAKQGATTLIRQLAEDLATRDLEITSLRRKAEERERELKKMLREVEVSNLDIETRMHRIGNLSERPQATTLQAQTTKQHTKVGDGRERINDITAGIDEMMGEAMKGDVATTPELDENYIDSLHEHNKRATIRGAGPIAKDSDQRSLDSSIDSQGRPSSTVRGWRDYLWGGYTSSRKSSRASSIITDYDDDADATARVRALSGVSGRRKGLDEQLFLPPHQSPQSSNTNSRSRKSSTSVSSWTMKLFAGNPQAGRDPDSQQTVRGRSVTTGSGGSKNPRVPSSTSMKTESSAKAALMKVNGAGPTQTIKKKPLGLGLNGAMRSVTQSSNSQIPTSPKSVDTASNLGPVEMDTILPADSRPPTQTLTNHNNHNPGEYLTDRFGFIYDQRRRKREAETLTSITNQDERSNGVETLTGSRDAVKPKDVDGSNGAKTALLQRPDTPASTEEKATERQMKRWHDYLKVATFPTELLSHTPAASPTMTVDTPDIVARSPIAGSAKTSLPSTSLNPQPSASPVTASNAEISKPAVNVSANLSMSAADNEPVKILLAQLTELHDSLQRERTVKWNELLRKVRAERKKEGETAASTASSSTQLSMPEVALADGEMIGVAGLGNKGKVGQAKWKEFKQLVLAGIPVAYRAKIWAECSGANALRVPGYYDDLVANGEDDPVIVAQIQMDIYRTLTDNVFFRKGPGVVKLNEVLLAYSRRNPEVGYCQGMNLITASLLLIMPTAEDAFWVLTSIVENILPRHYYDHSLLASRADQQVLRQYVAEILPKLSAHLDALGIELEALTFQWFLSIFTDCLSAEALFRVWDVVLCFNDGSTFLFQVALALLKLNESKLLSEQTAAGVYGYIGHEMTDHAISIDGLVRASEALGKVVRRAEVEERRARVVEEMQAQQSGRGNGELNVVEPRAVDE